jgi:hypothetical protein
LLRNTIPNSKEQKWKAHILLLDMTVWDEKEAHWNSEIHFQFLQLHLGRSTGWSQTTKFKIICAMLLAVECRSSYLMWVSV